MSFTSSLLQKASIMKQFCLSFALIILIQVSDILSQKPKCGENEIFYDSLDTSTGCTNACQSSCGNQICTQQCQSGCFCKPGWKKDVDNCVPESLCPKICGKNETYYDFSSNRPGCRNPCENDCVNLNRPCEEDCRAGCFCKLGWYFDGTKRECVPKIKCPKCKIQ